MKTVIKTIPDGLGFIYKYAISPVASFIRRIVSPRGSSKIVSQTALKILRLGGLFRNKFVNAVPKARQILLNVRRNARPVANSIVKSVKNLLTKNRFGRSVTNISKFVTDPKLIKKVTQLTKPLRIVSKFIPYLDLAATTLDLGLDLATAKTEKEKERAKGKAIATVVGGVVGGVAGFLGFGVGAVGGAATGAAIASTLVDVAYWVEDNKDRGILKKVSDTVFGIGNKFKSAVGF